MESPSKPQPLLATEGDRVYWSGVREHRLLVTRCRNCGHTSHPRVACACAVPAPEWVEASGLGSVYTFIVYHRAYHPAFAAETPYNVAWVQLEEGPLLMTNIIGCELADIRIGMPVRVVYDEEANGMILPRFAPAGSQSSG
ncbi:MAG: Zn-ribbon domain-containing OB-fold protein [Gammaproteobacteria bacterium]|nr:MAG: Zn-ribbon domain-containing OB-fold protein [Gammaproteobacteria bacterium]